ncbi:uncharacterized protein [Dysidea avara]|uniref:uncharacterized protein isoform X15 n=1 Tax=Dysidea avara TaxID=196820 RepID=UPI00331E8FD9
MLSFLAIGCLTLLRLFICMHITDLCPSILSTHHSVPLKLCTISFIFAVDRLAIASRLSKRVSAVNNQIKKMLRSFNEGLPVEDHTIWEAAINIHRNSYTASLASIATSIPIEVKREAVQKFRTAKRSLEEIALLKDEMRNCLEYYQRQIASLKRSQEEIHLQLHEQEKDVEKLSGCYCWISRKILIFSTKLTDLLSLFRNIVPEVIPPSMGTSEASTENHFPLTSYTDNSSSCFHFHSNETDEDPSVSGAVGNRTEDVQPRMNTPVSRAVGNRTEDDQPRVYITVSGAVGNRTEDDQPRVYTTVGGAVGNRTEDDQPRVNNTVGGAVGNRTEDGRPRVNTTVGGAVGNRTGDGQPRVNTTVGGAVSNRTGDGQPRVNTTVGGAVGNRTGDGQPRVNTTVGGAVGNRTGDGQPRVNTTVGGAVGNRTGDGRPRVNTTVGGAVGNRTGDGRPRMNTTVGGAVGNRTGNGRPRVNTTVSGAVGNRTEDGRPRVNTTVGGAVGNRTGDGRPRVNTTVSGAVGNRTEDGRQKVNTTVGGAVGNKLGMISQEKLCSLRVMKLLCCCHPQDNQLVLDRLYKARIYTVTLFHQPT